MAGNYLLHAAPGVPQNRTAFLKKVHLASFHFDIKENLLFKAGETAQQVKALVALTEGLGSVPSTLMVNHSHL